MTHHILVIGANGFVGSHLVQQALSMGWNVDGVKRTNSNITHFEAIEKYYRGESSIESELIENLKSELSEFADSNLTYKQNSNANRGDFKWIELDLQDPVSLVETLNTPYSFVFNAAAMISFKSSEDDFMIKTNIEIAKNIVNACLEANCRNLVHFSSIAALGRPENDEEININTTWTDSDFNTPYALSKYLSEMEVWRGAQEGLNVLIVNPGVILGYSSGKTSSTQVIDAANSKNPFVPTGSNGFIFVEDLAHRTLNLLDNSENWNCRHLMVSHNIPFIRLFEIINNVYQTKRKKILLKQPLWSVIYYLVRMLEFFKLHLPISTHLLKSTRKNSVYNNKIGATRSRCFVV